VGARHNFEAPSFGLPLNNVGWNIFMPDDDYYFGFGGEMDYQGSGAMQNEVLSFTSDKYWGVNTAEHRASIAEAENRLKNAQALESEGRLDEAKEELQQALIVSNGDNEDARVRLDSLRKQQFKMGMVNRNDAIRYSRNSYDEGQLDRMQGFQEGNFGREYAKRVERELGARYNKALDMVADRFVAVQSAAEETFPSISITIPQNGRRLSFYRQKHVDAGKPLSVHFMAGSGRVIGGLGAVWPAVILFLAVLVYGMLRRKPEPAIGNAA
jgi:tetratricopeptide (TPR) repeat protein